ncbi:MAG: photosystem I reaction center subunit XI, partial [Cyanobacteriota bacterium]
GWAEFASGFWLGGCGGAAFAWFLCGTTLVGPLVNIAGGVWSVG